MGTQRQGGLGADIIKILEDISKNAYRSYLKLFLADAYLDSCWSHRKSTQSGKRRQFVILAKSMSRTG